jgi:hypothetical protein
LRQKIFLLNEEVTLNRVNLRSTNSATLLTDYDVEVLAYANDNIYGRGAVSTWAPGGTLPGWVDLASGI